MLPFTFSLEKEVKLQAVILPFHLWIGSKFTIA